MLHRYLLFLFCCFFTGTLIYFLEVADVNYFVDLRNRVVGARLMALDMDPYFFKWDSSFPLTLCDPIDSCNISNNMTTSPPSYLWLFRPIALLPYKQAGQCIVLIHYLFFLLISLPIYAMQKDEAGKNRVLLAAIILLLTPQWTESIAKGQNHFLLPAILSLVMFVCAQRYRQRYFLAGLLLAILVWLRPNALLFLPFLLFAEIEKRNLFTGIIAGGILLGTFELSTHFDHWLSFYRSCKMWVWNNEHIMTAHHCHVEIQTEGIGLYGSPPPAWTPAIQSEQGNIFHLVKSKYGVVIEPIYLSILFVLSFLLLFLRSFKRKFSLEAALFAGFIAYWLAAVTAPILRLTYYFLELFPAILFLAGQYLTLTKRVQYALTAAAIVLLMDIIPINLVVAECLFMAALVMYVFGPLTKTDAPIPTHDRSFQY